MRIITGAFKGRRLTAPTGELIRPTSDRVREFIFSVIGQEVQGAAVLDLFAGSGAMGLEAKSRGAEHVDFVDVTRPALESIRRNCETVGYQARIVRGDAVRVLVELTETFDIVFCDPPYQYPNFTAVLETIRAEKRLAPDGLLVYESSSREPAPQADGWKIVRQKKMGGTLVTFYQLDPV